MEKYMVTFSRGSRVCIGIKYVLRVSNLNVPYCRTATLRPNALVKAVSYNLFRLSSLIPPNSSGIKFLAIPLARYKFYCSWMVQCSLAYAELNLTLAHLFRRFDLEFFQTTEEDLEWDDCLVPMTWGHLRVIVRQAQD